MGAPYRGRFAPSPTGALHLGTARTALLAWLRARQAGGSLVLRLEDLDTPRIRPGAAEGLMEDLRWLGLEWDEGPYVQSARLGLYGEAFDRFRRQGLLYECTCSRSEIAAAASAPHGEEGPLYPGTCRAGVSRPPRPAAWRFAMRSPERVEDRLAGSQAELSDDFVVRRADGVYAYQWACALDDAAMGVTEVLRGADLLGSAARQQALHKALGAPVPAWAHVPLWLGPDGARLAKRHGAAGIAQRRAAGETPGRVLGLLASSLGWLPAGVETDLGELLGLARWDGWKA